METDTTFHLNLEYPVEIEAILNLSFNLEGFKSVFEFILINLRRHESLFKSQSEKIIPLTSLPNDLHSALSRISAAESNINSLQNTQNSLIKDLKDLQDYKEANEKLNQITDERLRNLEQSAKDHKQGENDLKQSANDHNWAELKAAVDRHETALNEFSRLMDQLGSDLQDLSEKSEKIQKYGFETRDKLEGHSAKLADHEKRIHKLELDMSQALKAINGLGGEVEQMSKPVEVQPAEVNVVVDNSKLDFLEDSLKDLLKKMSEFESRVRSAEENSSKAKTLAERLESSLKNAEMDLRTLKNRPSDSGSKPQPDTHSFVSTEDLDSFTSMIRNIESQLSSKQSSSDHDKSLQDLLSRLEDLSSKLRLIESNLSKRVLKSELDDLLKSFNSRQPVKDEPFDTSKLTSLSKRIGAVEEGLLKLVLPQGFDLVMIVNIVVKMQQETKELKDKTDKSSKDIWAKLREIEDLLSKKASLERLKELEEMLLARLKEMSEEFIKKFADKSETKRAMSYLTKLLKDFESVKIVRDGEDAMLARKPLGGWSCLSCQKELEKLMGKIAPYTAWNKMPYRDPADRIARAGPGFSRMLATVQPEMLSGRGKNSVNSPYMGHVEEDEQKAFPPVKKGSDRPFTSL